MKTMKFHIWSDGDRSVGINGDQTELELNIDGLDEQDRIEFISHAKEVLGKAFSELWDDKAHVATEDELCAQAECCERAG